MNRCLLIDGCSVKQHRLADSSIIFPTNFLVNLTLGIHQDNTEMLLLMKHGSRIWITQLKFETIQTKWNKPKICTEIDFWITASKCPPFIAVKNHFVAQKVLTQHNVS